MQCWSSSCLLGACAPVKQNPGLKLSHECVCWRVKQAADPAKASEDPDAARTGGVIESTLAAGSAAAAVVGNKVADLIGSVSGTGSRVSSAA